MATCSSHSRVRSRSGQCSLWQRRALPPGIMKTMLLTVPSDLWYFTYLQLRTACGTCKLMCRVGTIHLLDSLMLKVSQTVLQNTRDMSTRLTSLYRTDSLCFFPLLEHRRRSGRLVFRTLIIAVISLFSRTTANREPEPYISNLRSALAFSSRTAGS